MSAWLFQRRRHGSASDVPVQTSVHAWCRCAEIREYGSWVPRGRQYEEAFPLLEQALIPSIDMADRHRSSWPVWFKQDHSSEKR